MSGASRIQQMSLGIVIPTYRESDNIAQLIMELRQVIPGCKVIVVDDSPDQLTMEAVQNLGDVKTTAIHRVRKAGRGSAVLTGLAMHVETGADRIVEMDADFSHPPSEIPDLLETMEATGVDMLIASRYLPESHISNWPLARRLFSRYSNWFARTLLRIPVRDYTNGFRVYRHEAARTVVDTCGRIGTGFIPLSETLVNLYYRGFTVGEKPTLFVNRSRGESSLSLGEITNALFGLIRIWRLRQDLVRNRARQPHE